MAPFFGLGGLGLALGGGQRCVDERHDTDEHLGQQACMPPGAGSRHGQRDDPLGLELA
ncbi:MAG: hypothetical protein QM740_13260 [Acidovorax sp.]